MIWSPYGATKKTEVYNGTAWANGGDLLTGRYQLAGGGASSNAICMGGLNSQGITVLSATEVYSGGSSSIVIPVFMSQYRQRRT
jgi:hypothetical protein